MRHSEGVVPSCSMTFMTLDISSMACRGSWQSSAARQAPGPGAVFLRVRLHSLVKASAVKGVTATSSDCVHASTLERTYAEMSSSVVSLGWATCCQ
eukprot:6489052-Amphidinium_carterae.3